MNTRRLVLFLISANVVIAEGSNETDPIIPEPKNAFKFEGQHDAQSYGLIRFEDQNRFQQHDNRFRFQKYNNLDDKTQQFDGTQNTIDQRIKFEDQDNRFQQYGSQHIDEAQRVKFEENPKNQIPQQKKKRRRKPKRLPNSQGGYGYVRPYPEPIYPGYPAYPGSPIYPGTFSPGPIYPEQKPYQPSYPVQLFRPRPSATSAALSAVTEALTSVALYDDAQCVPRLLCEAAGGGAVPGAGLLQSVAGLQPLLTLLAAYNGISSSPLFIFGRAVFLGMTSKASPGTCRYAYPQCPNDPEQLVHYLNNHNGGFFRFFAAPELNQQQGLEQFYNQLSGQSYGLYQPQQNPLQQQNSQQGYGLQQNYPHQHLYGQYQNQLHQGSYQNQNLQPDQGLAQNQYYNQNNNQRPTPYGNRYGLYGQSYPYQKNLNEKKIQKRIQNVRNTAFVKNGSSKWSFPEDASSNKDYSNVRLGKVLKFPQSNVNSVTAAEGFIFPGVQTNREYPLDSIESEDNDLGSKVVHDFEFYNQNSQGLDDGNNSNDGVRILYVVRGNGDPNNPEIVRLAPGQTL